MKWVLIFLNLSALIFYKYLKVFAANEASYLATIVAPLGLSYFVFDQISFIVDAYKKELPTYHLGHFLSTSLFFGKFTSGPIERVHSLANHFVEMKQVDLAFLRGAVLLIYWGLFKKCVIADNITLISTDHITAQAPLVGLPLYFAVLLNKYQIWANFSGYTDIARGVGRIFGIELSENFKRPFNSLTIREFWKRWHISLSSWIRDYVFYPLLTTGLSRFGTYLLIMITFLVFALWHDLKWTFVIYAIIQVVLIYISDKTSPYIEKGVSAIKAPMVREAINFFRKVWVYVVLVSIPSLFFTSQDLSYIYTLITNLGRFEVGDITGYLNGLYLSVPAVVSLIVFVEWVESKRDGRQIENFLAKSNYFVEVIFYYMLIILFMYFARINSSANFIYNNY